MIKVNSVFDISYKNKNFIKDQEQKEIILGENMAKGQLYAEKLKFTELQKFENASYISMSDNGLYIAYIYNSYIKVYKKENSTFILKFSEKIYFSTSIISISYNGEYIFIYATANSETGTIYLIKIYKKNNDDTYFETQTIQLNTIQNGTYTLQYINNISFSKDCSLLVLNHLYANNKSVSGITVFKNNGSGVFSKLPDSTINLPVDTSMSTFYENQYFVVAHKEYNGTMISLYSVSTSSNSFSLISSFKIPPKKENTYYIINTSNSFNGICIFKNFQYLILSPYGGQIIVFKIENNTANYLDSFISNNSYYPKLFATNQFIFSYLGSQFNTCTIDIVNNEKLQVMYSFFENGLSSSSVISTCLESNLVFVYNTLYEYEKSYIKVNDISDLKRCYRIGYTLESGRKGDTVKAMEIMKLEGLED